jgi:hypothetical protein
VTTWTSEAIHISDDLLIDVQATSEGVTCRKSVEGVYASDLLLTPEQAKQYGQALIEGSAHSRAMKGE